MKWLVKVILSIVSGSAPSSTGKSLSTKGRRLMNKTPSERATAAGEKSKKEARVRLDSLAEDANLSDQKKKKARTTFTGRQIFALEKQFEKKKYLSSSERVDMAKMLNVTETQVRFSFNSLFAINFQSLISRFLVAHTQIQKIQRLKYCFCGCR